MKEQQQTVTRYVCETCSKVYADREAAGACESRHRQETCRHETLEPDDCEMESIAEDDEVYETHLQRKCKDCGGIVSKKVDTWDTDLMLAFWDTLVNYEQKT